MCGNIDQICQTPTSGSVLGIDIGYSETRRSSAGCRLDWDLTEATFCITRFRALEPERSNAIRNLIDRPLLVAAFDGPLRSDLKVIGRYRLAEQLLTRRLRPLIGKPGQASSPVGKRLNAHANACAKIVLELGLLGTAVHDHAINRLAIVEAFPSSFLGVLIENPAILTARRGDRSDKFFVHLNESGGLLELLQHLLPGRTTKSFAKVSNHDDRAALICALTALCIVSGDYTAIGDADGWIILPPARLIRPWAWSLLHQNAQYGGLEWRNPRSKAGALLLHSTSRSSP